MLNLNSMHSLSQLKRAIEPHLKDVDGIIDTAFKKSECPTLKQMYQHLSQSKGKQIRASLIVIISTMISTPVSPAITRLAAGIELIHLASLIHDDIIDDAPIRRNQATIHNAFGTNNAIISGVHCYALALELVTSIGNIQVLNIISTSVLHLCEGESIQFNERHNYDLTFDQYWTIVRKKTSALFVAACKSAGILCDLHEDDLHHLSQFAEALGSIFQLSDDYLDIFDTNNALSKKVLQDLNCGDISLPILLASNQCKVKDATSIKAYLSNHATEISKHIETELISKKQDALSHLTHISAAYDTNQLVKLLDIITQRVLG